jgi:hypothetical protein
MTMRIRRTGAAVLVAGALSVAMSVALPGAASAEEPDPDSDRHDDRAAVVIVRCENGELVRRELTDEEREQLPALPAEPTWTGVPGERAEPGSRIAKRPPRTLHTVPAEPGAPAEARCAVPARP